MADAPGATRNRSLQPANARTRCAAGRHKVSCCVTSSHRAIDAGTMIAMPLQGSDTPHPQRRRAKRSAAAGRVKRHGPTRQPVVPTAATRLPQRPDPSILSEAIPLFFIGRNKDGFWVALDADGSVGGIFLLKHSALRFANTNTQPRGCATMFVEETLRTRHREQRQPVCCSPWRREAARIASCTATSPYISHYLCMIGQICEE